MRCQPRIRLLDRDELGRVPVGIACTFTGVAHPTSALTARLSPTQWDVYDYVIYAAGQYGLRVILPLTDDYDYYHGGKYTFLRWLGLNTGNWGTLFYSNAQAIAAYKVRFRSRTRWTSATLTRDLSTAIRLRL